MDARTSKRQKKISAKQEQRMARDLGGRVQPASGAMPHAKGDVRKMGVVRAEAKYTSKSTYSLKLEELDKIVAEAGLDRAVLQVCFVDRSSRPLLEIAIFPFPQGADSLVGTVNADMQTFAKSLRLDRDRLSLKLMKANIYIVFTESDNPLSNIASAHHRWFRVKYWKDYVTMMEEEGGSLLVDRGGK